MIIERVAIRFNRFIFENFYAAESSDYSVPIDIYSKTTQLPVFSVKSTKEGGYTYMDSSRDVAFYSSSDYLFMHVPGYFLEMFSDLVKYEGSFRPITYFSV